jgi:glucose/arabinose dehydrogenase
MRRLAVFAVWLVLVCSGFSTEALAIPALEPLLSGLNQPVLLTHARDGSNRKFIVEQPGRILVLQPGSQTPSVFLDIRMRVLSGGEQGLLGLAFHPQYGINGRFFVNYTRQTDGATVIAEYRVVSGNANAADPSSEIKLLVIPHPFANHNGGMIEFGPDNFLYIATGDGGSGNDPDNRAQNIDDLLGKILRIDVDHPQSADVPYSSPSSNPFSGSTAGRDEIFAIGFRNPWRFSFDRLNGQLFAGDVGESSREEIDIVKRGGNYGWRVFEGTRCTGLGPASCVTLGATPPIVEYNNGEFGHCAVTGGYVYRGSRHSLTIGSYVFADYCSGEIFLLEDGAMTVLMDTTMSISSFGEDEAGEIYVVDHAGSVSRITTSTFATTAQRAFDLPGRGGVFLTSNSAETSLLAGYARIQADTGDALPSGRAILEWHAHGMLISELTLPASPTIQSGRIFALVADQVTTGIAITNPNSSAVDVDFNFTDANGQDFGHGSVTIAANNQISAFLDQKPFNGGKTIQGTFTFLASAPVAVMAIRGFTNERGDFLISALPVTRINTSLLTTNIFPHWAIGEGWSAEFILVNPSEVLSTGQIELRGRDGVLLETLSYNIPARSSRRVIPVTTSPTLMSGSARLVVTAGTLPSGALLFRYSDDGGTLVETIDPAIAPGLVFRGYGELSGASRTGLALANTTSQQTSVTIELRRLTGAVQSTATIALPAGNHRAFFLDEVPGLDPSSPFQGIVQVSSVTPIVAALFRTRTSPQGDFLIASIPPDNVADVIPGSESFFPFIGMGGGAEMEFILLNAQGSASASGTMFFTASDGQRFSVATP